MRQRKDHPCDSSSGISKAAPYPMFLRRLPRTGTVMRSILCRATSSVLLSPSAMSPRASWPASVSWCRMRRAQIRVHIQVMSTLSLGIHSGLTGAAMCLACRRSRRRSILIMSFAILRLCRLPIMPQYVRFNSLLHRVRAPWHQPIWGSVPCCLRFC